MNLVGEGKEALLGSLGISKQNHIIIIVRQLVTYRITHTKSKYVESSRDGPHVKHIKKKNLVQIQNPLEHDLHGPRLQFWPGAT